MLLRCTAPSPELGLIKQRKESNGNLIKPININRKGEVVGLQSKRYWVYLLGGWGINIGGFMLRLKNVANGETVECKKAFFRVQAYAYNRRAKRIFKFDIKQPGDYEVIFVNANTLQVKRSNLPIFSSFIKPTSNIKLKVLITEKTGFSPFID